MMIADVGDIPKVSGSRSATPDTGPMPGRAPISVPTATPASAMNRLKGVSAIEKPRSRLSKMSTGGLDPEDAHREGDLEPVREDQVGEGRHPDRDGRRLAPRVALEEAQDPEQEQGRPQDHADPGEQGDEEGGGAEDDR